MMDTEDGPTKNEVKNAAEKATELANHQLERLTRDLPNLLASQDWEVITLHKRLEGQRALMEKTIATLDSVGEKLDRESLDEIVNFLVDNESVHQPAIEKMLTRLIARESQRSVEPPTPLDKQLPRVMQLMEAVQNIAFLLNNPRLVQSPTDHDAFKEAMGDLSEKITQLQDQLSAQLDAGEQTTWAINVNELNNKVLKFLEQPKSNRQSMR